MLLKPKVLHNATKSKTVLIWMVTRCSWFHSLKMQWWLYIMLYNLTLLTCKGLKCKCLLTARSNTWPSECLPRMKCTPQQCRTQCWSYHGTFSVPHRGSNLGPLGWQPSTHYTVHCELNNVQFFLSAEQNVLTAKRVVEACLFVRSFVSRSVSQ